MKLVTQTDAASERFGDKEAVKLICEAGFDGLDYSMFSMGDEGCILDTPAYVSHVKELKSIADYYGKTFEQAHAPFPSHHETDMEYNAVIEDRIKRSLEISGILGVKICIVHPAAQYKENMRENNLLMYERLLPAAKEAGVKIALENMWGSEPFSASRKGPNICSTPEDFNSYMDVLDKEWYTACLDLGHCGLVREDCADMIRKMGKRIGCLHVHDNDYLNDLHVIPYLGRMDWEGITQALADVGYEGNLTFEADNFIRKFPNEMTGACLKFMENEGRFLIDKIQSKMKN